MKNYIQPGDNITVPSPIFAVSGAGVQIGGLFGIANSTTQVGESLVLSTTGVFDIEKVLTDDLSLGDPVYWDDTTRKITVEATDNLLVGHAVKAAGNPSATATVRLSV